MIGTIANTATILAGSLVGSRLKSGLAERYKEALMNGMGLAAALLGVNSVVQAMPESRYSVLFIVSLAVGGVLGTAISLDSLFQKAVDKLPLAGGSELGKGLSTAILLFCAGTLSILGPMQSALQGDNTYLFTNTVLDGITSTVLASTFGIGIALVALVLFCWQGAIYLLSGAIAPYVTTELLTELSLVGGALIFSSGLGILGIKQIKTLNYLPALAVSAAAVVVLQALGL